MKNRKTTRLENWDYGWNALYFITICTKNRENYFGEVIDGEMHLSNMGTVANVLWYEIKNHAKDIELKEFVVMPNHIHGIIFLNSDNDKTQYIGKERFQNQGKNTISSIIGSYKSSVTKHANRLNFDFAWHSRFYDNIIRDEKSYYTITDYIIHNPIRWKEDMFYT